MKSGGDLDGGGKNAKPSDLLSIVESTVALCDKEPSEEELAQRIISDIVEDVNSETRAPLNYNVIL